MDDVNTQILAIFLEEGNKLLAHFLNHQRSERPEPSLPAESPEEALARIYSTKSAISPSDPKETLPPATVIPPPAKETTPDQDVATACIPCSIGHFGTSAGLLNEAVRFKKEGMTSNEILDRIAKALEEQNTLERVDLASEKLQATQGWEKPVAEEALTQSRNLRHRLENIETLDELQKIAADTETYYKKLNSAWFRGKMGQKKSLGKQAVEPAEAMASEQKAKI